MLAANVLRPAASDDDRALETDIMRFMAILGFCLMAIFALIQSIPVTQQQAGVTLQSSQLLEQQVSALADELRAVESRLQELLNLAAEQQQRLDRLQQTNQELQQALALSNESVAAAATTLRTLEEQRQQLAAQLHTDSQDLHAAQQKVSELRRAAALADAKLETVRRQLQRQQTALTDPSTAKAEPPPVAMPAAVATTQARSPTASSPPAPARKPAPLTMRFESTLALERLIAAGRVVLFGVSDSRAWRSDRSGRFVAAAKPQQPYQLTESPGGRLQQQFRSGSGLLAAKPVQWWVTLDARLVSRISALVEQHRSGQLVIKATGAVQHHLVGASQ